ncbi:MAG: hypothetical protein D3903_05485 [Candidatus Electrothrix sp. GM3_4]|nr:hypothetical protein [Candidatus Electrothrix sp. GM3_4]
MVSSQGSEQSRTGRDSLEPPFLQILCQLSKILRNSQKKLALFDFSFSLGYSIKPVCGLLNFVVKSADLSCVIRIAIRS